MSEAIQEDLVELAPARRGADLYAAIEAGQYARVIDHDAPGTPAEAEAMTGFVGQLHDCCESWDGKSAMEQSAALAGLGGLLDKLRKRGLGAFWTVAERQFKTPAGDLRALPVAVVKLARHSQARVAVRVPRVIDANPS